MQILGIDPGYATTGFGVLQAERGQLRLLNYGTITTPAGPALSKRLVMLYDDMMKLLNTVKPDAVAVEELFWGHNVTTGIGVSHGQGRHSAGDRAIRRAAFRVYAQSGQAGRGRLRRRGQAAGHGHDAADSENGKGGAAGRRGGRHRHRAVPRAQRYDVASEPQKEV